MNESFLSNLLADFLFIQVSFFEFYICGSDEMENVA